MGAPEITAFLSWLATGQRVSSSTQNQALSAVLFLYRDVLRIEVGAIEQVPRAKLPHRVPVVLSVRGTVSRSSLCHIDASFNESDFGVSCDGGAANAGAPCIRCAEYEIHIRGVATFYRQVSFPALAATSHRSHTRPAAKPVRRGAGGLIFEDFGARLHRQPPAMAASGTSRSTQ